MYLKTDAEREIWAYVYKAALFGAFTRGYGSRPGAQHAAECAHAAVREYCAIRGGRARRPIAEIRNGTGWPRGARFALVSPFDGAPDTEGATVSADRDGHDTRSGGTVPAAPTDTQPNT